MNFIQLYFAIFLCKMYFVMQSRIIRVFLLVALMKLVKESATKQTLKGLIYVVDNYDSCDRFNERVVISEMNCIMHEVQARIAARRDQGRAPGPHSKSRN